ncbi:hypothetical protein D3C78_1683620 [compost metagenome]
MDRVHGGQAAGGQGMPHLVIRHHLALVGVQQAALALNPRDDTFHRRGEIVEADRLGAAAGGHDGGFVDQVG